MVRLLQKGDGVLYSSCLLAAKSLVYANDSGLKRGQRGSNFLE